MIIDRRRRGHPAGTAGFSCTFSSKRLRSIQVPALVIIYISALYDGAK